MKRLKFSSASGVLCVFFCWALSSGAGASSSVGFDVSGGIGESGYSVEGDLGIPPLAETSATQVSLSYASQHVTVGTESRSSQYTLGLSNTVDDNLEGHGTLNYWKDTLNDIQYAGPSFGFTYTWTNAVQVSIPDQKDKDQREAPSVEGSLLEKPPAPDERCALSLNSDIFIYGTDISASPKTRRVFDTATRRYVTTIIPGGTADDHVTQLHPSLTYEVPFFDHQVTPSITYGHYFYSKNPGDLEALVGRPRFSGSSDQINGLVGGFLNNNAEAALQFLLPGDIDATTRVGADQSVTDNSWAAVGGVTVNRTFFDHLRVKLDWSRAVQEGISTDVFTGGLTYVF